ncbi:MAG: cytochrome c family protein [Bacteroidetes bacterium]|nr:cytochrome c family protein [Bacteroidota bacterium]
MYKEVDFFKHDWHTSASGANLRCDDCHTPGVTRTAQSAKKCTACHPAYKFLADEKNATEKYYIPSYVDAMHKLCVSCHTVEAKKVKDKPNLAQCSTCHRIGTPPELKAGMKWDVTLPHFDNVVLPDVGQAGK